VFKVEKITNINSEDVHLFVLPIGQKKSERSDADIYKALFKTIRVMAV